MVSFHHLKTNTAVSKSIFYFVESHNTLVFLVLWAKLAETSAGWWQRLGKKHYQ